MKKNVEFYKSLPYTIEIIPDGDVFFVKIKELPGCISQGQTKQEALEMIDEALACWLEAALEDVETIPLPESMQKTNYSGKLSLRMPKSLHKKIANEAKEEGVSINSYVISCLSENNAINKVTKMIDEKLNFDKHKFYNEKYANNTKVWYSADSDKKLLTFPQIGNFDSKTNTKVQKTVN